MPAIQPLKGPTEAPATYKQPSRKGKKAWRKNVNVTEVQRGLEVLNEEIIRGEFIAERPSDELFVADTVGDASIAKKFSERTCKPLKSEEIIATRSCVPSLDSRKRPGDRTTDGIVPAKRQRQGYVTHKELARLRLVAKGQHEEIVDTVDATHDPWAAEPQAKPKAEGEIFEVHDSRDDPKKAPKSLSLKPLSLAASGKPIPAVPKPTGGFSYNPTFHEYEARLIEESEKVLETESKRLAAEEAERLRAEAAARSAAEAEAAEARAELSEWDEDSEWEGFQSGGEELKVSAKRPQRKTPAQRIRIKRRMEEERRLKHESKHGVKKAQLEEIKRIASELAEREARQSALALAWNEENEISAEGDDSGLRRKALGKVKLPEKDLELVLPDELQDSLRLLKPEGNLLKDRYRSMLVRGKMEARRKIPFKKQARTKLTEKWAYKDFTI